MTVKNEVIVMEQMIFIVGIMCIFIGTFKVLKINSYTKVEGKCIELLERYSSRGGIFLNTKNAKYKYLYNGKEYVHKESGYYPNKRIKKDGKYNLRINPKNPSKCITPSDIRMIIDIFLLGF